MKTIGLAVLLAAAAVAPRPTVGTAAPEFSLAASSGKKISLADFKGERSVVLAFFPKAFTGG
jgi:peroxiredoxin Q/BCP